MDYFSFALQRDGLGKVWENVRRMWEKMWENTGNSIQKKLGLWGFLRGVRKWKIPALKSNTGKGLNGVRMWEYFFKPYIYKYTHNNIYYIHI